MTARELAGIMIVCIAGGFAGGVLVAAVITWRGGGLG